LRRARGLQTDDAAWRWLGSIRPENQVAACARVGLSPHAPYSTSGWLYYKAASSRLPLSTHLAEMPEELRLLEHRDGPLREFLEDLDAWDDDWEPIGPRPADYIRRGELREADWVIAHGTYFDPSEFWQLRPEAAPTGHRVAIAFCPSTHARGSLRPGKPADLAIIPLPDRSDHDPHDLLLESEEPVLATVFEGDFVTGPWMGI